jgi:Family of unknown function (DUF6328)
VSDQTRQGETKPERLDRELAELVQELRVLLPGVQVLFAFLLTIPFSAGFESVDDAERAVYMLAFGSTTVSAILLIAPVARHRARFRDHDKEQLVNTSNRLAMVATGFLGLAIAAVGLLIGEYLYGWLEGVVIAATTVAVIAWFWYGWAIMRRLTHDE